MLSEYVASDDFRSRNDVDVHVTFSFHFNLMIFTQGHKY